MMQDWSMFRAELATQDAQFDEKMEFDRWATQQGITADRAQMMWQSGENSLARAHETALQTMTMEAEKKGFNLQAVIAMAETLPPKQAAAMIRQEAEKNQISWVAVNPEEEAAVTKANVVDYVNGALDAKNLVPGSETYTAAVDTAPDVTTPSKYQVEPSGWGNDYYADQRLDSAMNNGSLVTYQGKVYQVSTRENVNQLGTDNSRYILTDPTTGSTIDVYIGD